MSRTRFSLLRVGVGWDLAIALLSALALAVVLLNAGAARYGERSLSATTWFIFPQKIDPGLHVFPANISLQEIIARSGASLALVVLALTLATALGLPWGFALAGRGPIPRLLLVPATALSVVPAFFVALGLQVVAVSLASSSNRTIFPVFGFGLDAHLVIPVLALSAAPTAFIARSLSVLVRDIRAREFVRTAQAKGLPGALIDRRHVFPNLRDGFVQMVVGALRLIVAGLVVVEYLAVWPGLGRLLLEAITGKQVIAFLVSIAILTLVGLALQFASDRTRVTTSASE